MFFVNASVLVKMVYFGHTYCTRQQGKNFCYLTIILAMCMVFLVKGGIKS
jgi:hypothetical protein